MGLEHQAAEHRPRATRVVVDATLAAEVKDALAARGVYVDVKAVASADVKAADVVFVDGDADHANDIVARVAATAPAAIVVVVADGGVARGFELARLGARAVLGRPVDPQALDAALTGTGLKDAVAELSRALVGSVGLKEAQAEMRRAMVEEALRQSGGNYAKAGRLLGITRQGLASALRDLGLTPADR